MRTVCIVLNWNGAELTRKCVAHLVAQTVPSHILIVDNGSTDGSIETLADLAGPRCELIALPENQGFAGGCNVAVEAAARMGAAYAWLINNDAFAEPDCLERLLDYMDRNPAVAMVTPRVLSLDGSEQHAGGAVDWYSGDPGDTSSASLSGVATRNRWITGTAPLLRLAALGGEPPFCNDFFAYWEDVDLSLRLTAQGYDLRALPSATVYHLRSASTGGHSSPMFLYLMVRNQWMVLNRHLTVRARPGAFLRYLAKYLVVYGEHVHAGEQSYATALRHALTDATRGKVGRPPATWPSGAPGILLRHPWRFASMMRTLARGADFVLRSPIRPAAPKRSAVG